MTHGDPGQVIFPLPPPGLCPLLGTLAAAPALFTAILGGLADRKALKEKALSTEQMNLRLKTG